MREKLILPDSDGRLLYSGVVTSDVSATPSVSEDSVSSGITVSRPERVCDGAVVTLEL